MPKRVCEEKQVLVGIKDNNQKSCRILKNEGDDAEDYQINFSEAKSKLKHIKKWADSTSD